MTVPPGSIALTLAGSLCGSRTLALACRRGALTFAESLRHATVEAASGGVLEFDRRAA